MELKDVRGIWLVGLGLCWALLGFAPPAAACGPFFYLPAYWLDRPEAWPTYLDGHLGILDGTFDDRSLFVAYRYLTDNPLSAATQAALLPPPPSEAAIDPTEEWLQAVREAGGEVPEWGSIWRETTEIVPEGEWGDYFLNCLDDAFRQATKTLKVRAAAWGPGSRETLEWIRGQQQVFASCSEAKDPPAPLGPEWPAELVADRAYQIAAAHFYAQRYDEAATRFESIAAEAKTGAPAGWSTLATLAAARARIRAGQLDAAATQLAAILARPELAEIHGSARRLANWVALRQGPGPQHRRLLEYLTSKSLGSDVGQTLTDYRWAASKLDDASRQDPLYDWLQALQNSETNQRQVFERYQREKSVVWLVAALIVAERVPVFAPVEAEAPDLGPGLSQEQLETLVAAAAKVKSNSPAFASARYHRARILTEIGREEDARRELDALLEQSGWTHADHQRLLALRAEVAKNLDEVLRFGVLTPLGETDEDHSPVQPLYAHENPRPLLVPSALWTLNRHTPVADWPKLLEGPPLPESYRRELAEVGFARTALAGQDELAAKFAAFLVASDSEALADLQVWQQTPPGPEKRFTAAFTLLRHPGFSVDLRPHWGRETPLGEIDSLRDNWWCGLDQDQIDTWAMPVAWREKPPAPDLRPADPGPIHLGQIVLEFAKSHPQDPRLAEALHRVVRATRFGCFGYSYKAVSKAAFDLLHKRFPKSEWAAQTRYWFD